MTDHGYNNNKSGGVMPCHNSPRRLAHIVGPLKNTRQIEIKPGLLQILYANPFAGLNHEDPYSHLTKFYEIADTLGASEAEEEAVFMRMFPHSLIGKAKDWYLDQPAQVMTNWNTLEEKFLNMFFPHHKFMEAKIAITLFSQGSNETLCEAWDRYKSMLRRCHNHDFDDLTQIHNFHNGLQRQPKLLLDAAAGGSLMSKSAEDAIVIIEKMALNDHQDEYNRNPSQRKLGVIELGTSDAMLAQNKLFTQTVEELTKQLSKLTALQEGSEKTKQVAYCELCSGDHQNGYCPPSNEEVNYMVNQQSHGQYQSNTGYQRRDNFNYGQGWREDARPSNTQHQHENYNQHPPQQNQNSKLEETLNKFMEMTISHQQQQQQYQQEQHLHHLKNIETKLGQMANMQGGTFVANTETNPNEHYKSISTRSGKVIGKDIGDNLENERVVVELNEKQEGEKEESEKETEEKNKDGELVENEKNGKSEIEENGEVFENNVEKLFSEEGTSMNSPYKIKLPYPPAPTKKIAIEENEELKKVGVVEKDQNEGEEEEKLVEKEEENNQERVKLNKVEIDEVIEYICALFNKKLRRTWTPHHLYFKFMEFLPNKLKTKDDVLSVSFWPP
ncbi:hypothetical protein TSUD_357000 [Trifolium subterraneum]|uniref:Retrotransposon gag domain-containing protein n=1 Tax=Trifolium subterraneum TaxID=3900 RepID=A0A2Z6NAT4_TRISU|nr:hypothetical protein TSUD_357000 [Trifolium subterraneum]